MKRFISKPGTDDYLRLNAGSVPVLARDGQLAVGTMKVHANGAGREGMRIIDNLVAAGVTFISNNDCQLMEFEQVGICNFARLSDLRRKKVFALERFYHGRPQFIYIPVPLPTEAPEVDSYVRDATVQVVAARSAAAHIIAAQRSLKYGKPNFATGVMDGRKALGGVVRWWLPQHPPETACTACGVSPDMSVPPGEGLLMPVVDLVAAIAASLMVRYAAGLQMEFLLRNNVLVLDASGFGFEPYMMARVAGCAACGGVPEPKD